MNTTRSLFTRKSLITFQLVLIVIILVTSACGTSAPQITEPPVDAGPGEVEETPFVREPLVIEDDVLYLAIIWHQHQPVYYKDPDSGLYQRPWVRMHAAKDYLDMASILLDYPQIQATFNLTPSLIRQLDDISAGARDLYWAYTEIPADQLTDSDKTFLLERFFDTNRSIIARFPRYQELLDQRDQDGIQEAVQTWQDSDFRDLQVLFNLAWTDPDWLAQDPLLGLVEKGKDYSEEDKSVVLTEHLDLLDQVIPFHAQMQESGQIEVTMTPYAHPILPLLVDSNLAAPGLPDADLPTRFVYGQDAVAQVKKGIEFYQDHFGTDPLGMWPAEGSVAEEVISMISNAGIRWIATDEDVLAQSLDEVSDFTRDNQDTVQQADALYQPYQVEGARGGPVAIIFRDKVISDMVGFQYSGTEGAEAAEDFLQRIRNIHTKLEENGADGPHLVTVLLDGENAWEYYPNDGKDFLHNLYQKLSEAEDIVTVTPGEYLEALDQAGEEIEQIEELWPGSWIDGTFSTWIGEEEENLAWEYLLRTRDDLQDAVLDGELDQAVLEQALDTMYIAEGSDWFWWYGADQNSGNDSSFDQQFRSYLKQVYLLIEEDPPSFVDVPIIPQAAEAPDLYPTGMLSAVQIDGTAEDEEWAAAGSYLLADQDLDTWHFGFDQENLYIRLDGTLEDTGDTVYSFYLNTPGKSPINAYPRGGEGDTLLGFGVKRVLEVAFDNGQTVLNILAADGAGGWEELSPSEAHQPEIAYQNGILEISLPFESFAPEVRSGDRINARLAVNDPVSITGIYPQGGPAQLTVPDLPIPNVFLEVSDPQGDDHGPGSYQYPSDGVFKSGAYDLTGFTAGWDDEFIIFRAQIKGPVENEWDSPNGMSIQTVDIYIDTDQGSSGDRILLPGRNAALTPEFAWNYAVWAEGWYPGIYQPSEEGPIEIGAGLEIIANPGQRRVTISVPRRLLPEGDPADWAYAVALLNQEGYPSAGVWRVRDVEIAVEQWRIGGGTGSNLDTRIMDLLWPEENPGIQEDFLTNPQPGSEVELESLTPDDYPQIPMVQP